MLRLIVYCGFFSFCTCSSAPLSENHSVVIIGAGAAGISAATRLLENGVTNIKIIEAEGRVGGRIKTVPFGGKYVDEGAQYVHGQEGNVVYQLVEDLDLLEHSTVLTHSRAKIYYSNGSTIDKELSTDMQDIIFNYEDVLQEEIRNISELSVGRAFIRQYIPRIVDKYPSAMKITVEGIIFAQTLILMNEGAFSWEDSSAARHYTRCKGDQMMAWKHKGYEMIFDVLTKALPNPGDKLPIDDKIILNTTVSKITWKEKQVSIATSNGTIFLTDYVIFTPSIGVLRADREKLFEPQLSDSKKEAIDALGFDGILKIMLHFPEKWWNDEDGAFFFLWSDEDLNKTLEENTFSPVRDIDNFSWISYIAGMVRVESNPNTLIGVVIGNVIPDIEKVDDDILLEGVMFVIRKFLGKDYNITNADQVVKSQWCSNPNFRGTFSYERTGYFKQNYSYQDQLAQPLMNSEGRPVVLFAGEATSPKHYSTVHGAIQSGFREADRIINLLKQ